MNTKNDNPTTIKTPTATDASASPAPNTSAASSAVKPVSRNTSDRTPTPPAGSLSPEVIELVTELRDTVKRLDPRRHTVKTLRRALTSISAILADIEAQFEQD